MTTIKSILVRLENLHQTLLVKSGKEHAKCLAEFNALVTKANKLLRSQTDSAGCPVWDCDLNGYELLELNDYISE
jgi:hypothetical protein